jgi:hypothetical protein
LLHDLQYRSRIGLEMHSILELLMGDRVCTKIDLDAVTRLHIAWGWEPGDAQLLPCGWVTALNHGHQIERADRQIVECQALRAGGIHSDRQRVAEICAAMFLPEIAMRQDLAILVADRAAMERALMKS